MLQFSKYEGLGNDFIIFDNRFQPEYITSWDPDPQWIAHLCNRHFGVGADGIIFILPPRDQGDLRMRIFNTNGTEAEMCGNGIRCLTKFLVDSETQSKKSNKWKIETLAGLMISELKQNGMICIDMGKPSFLAKDIPTKLSTGMNSIPLGIIDINKLSWSIAAVRIGNPHLVIPVKSLKDIRLDIWGFSLEKHFTFPSYTNVHFIEILSRDYIRMKTWERGVGPTLACGTGACSVVIVSHFLGFTEREAKVELPGGILLIDWQRSNNHLFMTGTAKAIFDGVLTPELTPNYSEYSSDTIESDQVNNTISSMTFKKILCSKNCVDGCLYPENCISIEARNQVTNFLNSSSLDEMITIANDSIEKRTRARINEDADISY